MKKLVRWVLPPFLLLLLVAQLTAATTQKEERIRAVVGKIVEKETNTVRELLGLEYEKALSSALLQTKISLSAEREANFSIECDASNARLEELWNKFREDQRRIEQDLERKINAFKSKPAPPEAIHPKNVSLLEYLLRQVEEKIPGTSHTVLNIRNAVVESLLEIGERYVISAIPPMPSLLKWTVVISMLLPGVLLPIWSRQQDRLALQPVAPLPFNLTPRDDAPSTEEMTKKPTQPASLLDTIDVPSFSADPPPNITNLRRYPQDKSLATLRMDVRDIFPSPAGPPQNDSSSSASSSSSSSSFSRQPAPSAPPQLSVEEMQKIKEKEEKGNKALAGWFDTFREDQVEALENARANRSPTENGLPARRSPGPIPGPNSTHNPTPRPVLSLPIEPTQPIPDDPPSLTVRSLGNPLSASGSSVDDDRPSPQEPEAVSDDELMEELMDEPILSHPFPKPFPSQPQQKQNPPAHQFGLPQFHSQGQLPPLQLENPQFQASRFQRMRADSEPVLLRSPAKPNPAINASPNPIVSPRESLTDSQSLRKNALRAKKPEREEPEPQPVQTSPVVVVPRVRSTSVESESQQATRVARTERNTTSSPTPISREAIYRKDLEAAQGDQDSASKPKRELEMSDNFESELEAESQPGSDSERDSDLE
eukprot:Phypoly_transcript_04989.p1 GENE.Phypoly_transcript_04989~~Phypoly_transcript_04989.p1  ORF type:complete len:654 (+),score=134.36 Phypoly_transcript_04989:25-1986(+)